MTTTLVSTATINRLDKLYRQAAVTFDAYLRSFSDTNPLQVEEARSEYIFALQRVAACAQTLARYQDEAGQ